jgi:hypothetical protein
MNDKIKLTPEQKKLNLLRYKDTYNNKNKDKKIFCDICLMDAPKLHFRHHLKSKKHLENSKKIMIDVLPSINIFEKLSIEKKEVCILNILETYSDIDAENLIRDSIIASLTTEYNNIYRNLFEICYESDSEEDDK